MITIAWWWIPVAFVIAGIAIPNFIQRQGDWDFGTPMLQAGIFIVCISIAISLCVGRFLP